MIHGRVLHTQDILFILGASKVARTHHLPICLCLHHSLIHLLIHSFHSLKWILESLGHALCKAEHRTWRGQETWVLGEAQACSVPSLLEVSGQQT